MNISDTQPHACRLLVVEDNPSDMDLIRRGLATMPEIEDVRFVDNGDEALCIIDTLSPSRGFFPDVILLDMNLPGADGQMILARIRDDPRFDGVPVIVFTTSDDPALAQRTYRRHANCFVSKPFGATAFIRTVTAMMRFWTQVALTPMDNTV